MKKWLLFFLTSYYLHFFFVSVFPYVLSVFYRLASIGDLHWLTYHHVLAYYSHLVIHFLIAAYVLQLLVLHLVEYYP
uniref:Secreted protein n=1 Tax=Panstrongylus lignarius TaxID=156445 RepID=A0A224XT88_9HEMI